MSKRPGSSVRGEQAGRNVQPSSEQLGAMRRLGRPPLGDRARRLIAIRLDAEVLMRFRKEARRRNIGYQTLIHRVLADYVRKHVA